MIKLDDEVKLILVGNEKLITHGKSLVNKTQ